MEQHDKKTTPPWGDDPEEQKEHILWFFDYYFSAEDEEGIDDAARFIIHTGLTKEEQDKAGDLEQAILNHYRCGCGRGYDVERVYQDLVTYPRIARRIVEIKYENAVKRGARGRTQKPN